MRKTPELISALYAGDIGRAELDKADHQQHHGYAGHGQEVVLAFSLRKPRS
jgi:hypothetical protein